MIVLWIDWNMNREQDLAIMHYYVRATYRPVNGEIKKFVITACGHRYNEINTTTERDEVTCRACLNTIRMGRTVKY